MLRLFAEKCFLVDEDFGIADLLVLSTSLYEWSMSDALHNHVGWYKSHRHCLCRANLVSNCVYEQVAGHLRMFEVNLRALPKT
jgi:hypothetical protein